MYKVLWGSVTKQVVDGAMLQTTEGEVFVHNLEQIKPFVVGKKYLVLCTKDEDSNGLVGSEKINLYLQDKVEENVFTPNQKVSGIIYKKTELGYKVIVDHKYVGVIYGQETYKQYEIGDVLDVYIKKIREDKKIDLSASPIGYKNFSTNTQELILAKIRESGGTLPLSDSSNPKEIIRILGISKKKFKDAIGSLYKKRKIQILKDSIKLV